jgi:hypothetical protein
MRTVFDSRYFIKTEKAHRELHGALFLQGEEGEESGEIKLLRHDPADSFSFDR